MVKDRRLNLSKFIYAGDFPDYDGELKTLPGGGVFSVGDVPLQILRTPGHTPGCVCIVAGDVIFTGDFLFAGSIGRTDFPGGDLDQMRKSLRRFSVTFPGRDFIIYPGHEKATTLERELRENPYLRF
jgi:glyoxylase-like metal-dependent hydrolase (beta-lactamase superfamily II)